MKPTVLITGVAGLLGSRLAAYLHQNNLATVIGIDDFSGGQKDFVPDCVQLHELDLIVQTSELDDVFERYKPDYVYHFAAYAAEGLSPFIRSYNYQSNIVTTANVVNSCIRYEVKRLVYTSSMAVYGKQDPPFDETLIPEPIDPYGIAKYAAEMEIREAGNHFGLDWCIIRPHNVYGINQNIWDPYRNVLGIWMVQHLNNEPMTIYGDGLQTRPFSYIDDSLNPLWIAATGEQASKEIINLGGVHSHSIREANEMLSEVMGGGKTIYREARHEAKFCHTTHQKSVDLLGFEHKTNLKEGLQKMWEWAKSQPPRKRKYWDKYELDKGIYSYWKK